MIRARTVAALAAGAWYGWRMEPNPGAGAAYFTACRAGLRVAVHVAIDGSIRYSDSERFGELWSVGFSGRRFFEK